MFLRLSCKGVPANDSATRASIASYLSSWGVSQDTNSPIGASLSWVQVLDAIKTGLGLDVRKFAMGASAPGSSDSPADVSMPKTGQATWSAADIVLDAWGGT